MSLIYFKICHEHSLICGRVNCMLFTVSGHAQMPLIETHHRYKSTKTEPQVKTPRKQTNHVYCDSHLFCGSYLLVCSRKEELYKVITQ